MTLMEYTAVMNIKWFDDSIDNTRNSAGIADLRKQRKLKRKRSEAYKVNLIII